MRLSCSRNQIIQSHVLIYLTCGLDSILVSKIFTTIKRKEPSFGMWPKPTLLLINQFMVQCHGKTIPHHMSNLAATVARSRMLQTWPVLVESFTLLASWTTKSIPMGLEVMTSRSCTP